MAFTSIQYLILLILVFAVYWAIPNRFRWILLLATSYYFYMSWNAKYVVLILGTTIISYAGALLMERFPGKKQKNLILTLGAVIILSVLFVFKYYSFFWESVNAVCSRFALPVHEVTLKLLLPVGISFYSFQTLGYLIDVYRGTTKAEHHFGKYATFIAFFPQLVAGPIERTNNLLPQICGEHHFSEEKATAGLKQMCWGFFKKLVIADMLAVYVDSVFENVRQYTGFSLFLASLFFTIQIYCDFSGYSDIAIGTAKLLDVDLMTNFKQPYFAQSIHEFWGRWHISLSQWFRDYVYIPMGGNRCSKARRSLNVMVTFLLSGLWHGANWTYVVWGGIHGIAQVLENILIKDKIGKNNFAKFIRILLVFCFACFAWIFFRANSISDAVYVICHQFSGIHELRMFRYNGLHDLGLEASDMIYIFVSLLVLLLHDITTEKNYKFSLPTWLNWAVYSLFAVAILCFRASANVSFVYFQF